MLYIQNVVLHCYYHSFLSNNARLTITLSSLLLLFTLAVIHSSCFLASESEILLATKILLYPNFLKCCLKKTFTKMYLVYHVLELVILIVVQKIIIIKSLLFYNPVGD